MDTPLKRSETLRTPALTTRPTPALCGLVAGFGLLAAGLASAQPASSASDESVMPPGYPSLDAPWTGKAAKAAPAPAPAAPAAAPAPGVPAAEPSPATPPPSATAPPELSTETALPVAPKIRKNEISASGDFFLGQGNVTLPFGFGLAEVLSPMVPGGLQGTVNKADRTSDYFGGTISYSYGQAWYLDLAYAHGSSSGNVPVALSESSLFETLNSSFSINDDWYQAYVRYTFPGLRGKRFSAYLRAGFSYVQATLTDQAPIPTFGTYLETDKTDDLLGNVGFGVGYSLYASRRIRLGVQAEGEGFYGRRTQQINESFPNDSNLVVPQVSIDNDLYGGIGRGTIRFEYRVGRTGAFKIFGDGGIQAKYSFINYSGLGGFTELLWGPYIKAGVRYSF